MRSILVAVALGVTVLAAPALAAPELQQAAGMIASTTAAFEKVAGEVSSTAAKAKEVVEVVSSTAKTATEAYGKAKGVVGAVVAVFERGQAILDRLQPMFKKITEVWLYLSHNNEPERVLVLVGAIAVVVIILRHL